MLNVNIFFFKFYLSFLLVPKRDFFAGLLFTSFRLSFSSSFFFLKTLKNIEILLALCLCTFSFHQSLIILLILKIFYWDRVSIEFLYITAFIMGGLINYYKLGLINLLFFAKILFVSHFTSQ